MAKPAAAPTKPPSSPTPSSPSRERLGRKRRRAARGYYHRGPWYRPTTSTPRAATTATRIQSDRVHAEDVCVCRLLRRYREPDPLSGAFAAPTMTSITTAIEMISARPNPNMVLTGIVNSKRQEGHQRLAQLGSFVPTRQHCPELLDVAGFCLPRRRAPGGGHTNLSLRRLV